MANLSGLLQFDERPDGLGVGNVGVRNVNLIEVDAVEPEPLEAQVALGPDVLRATERRQGTLAGLDLPRPEPGFGTDEQIRGIGVQRLGQEGLALTVAIDVGDIDEVDAALVDPPVERDGLGRVSLPLGVAGRRDAHGAEAAIIGPPHVR